MFDEEVTYTEGKPSPILVLILLPLVLFVLMSLLICSCSPAKCEEYQSSYYNVHNYEIGQTTYTWNTIEVDTTGQEVDLSLVDQMVTAVEDCLADIGTLSYEEGRAAWCLRSTENRFIIPREIKRECLLIKIPDNWVMSCDGKEQLLRNKAPFEGCRQKGFGEDPNCPCRWRAAIQDTWIIVVTPNLRLLGDPLVKLVTDCDYPWGSEKLARCANIPTEMSYEYFGE
jgi:hypothetical protein